MTKLETRKFLILSTAHITKQTNEYLTKTHVSRWPFPGGPYGQDGWFFYAAPDNENETIPADLFKVMEFARANGCFNVLLDCDGDTVEGLPTYDW